METKGFNIRVPIELYQWLKERSQKNERSLNREIVMILKQARDKESPNGKNM